MTDSWGHSKKAKGLDYLANFPGWKLDIYKFKMGRNYYCLKWFTYLNPLRRMKQLTFCLLEKDSDLYLIVAQLRSRPYSSELCVCVPVCTSLSLMTKK